MSDHVRRDWLLSGFRGNPRWDFYLTRIKTNGSILGGSERTLWEEEKRSVKTCVDESSTIVCVFHSFHKKNRPTGPFLCCCLLLSYTTLHTHIKNHWFSWCSVHICSWCLNRNRWSTDRRHKTEYMFRGDVVLLILRTWHVSKFWSRWSTREV